MTKPRKKPKPQAPPESIRALIPKFIEYQRVRGFSELAFESRIAFLKLFTDWCEDRDVTRAREVTKTVIEAYQRYLYHKRKRDGQPLAPRGQVAHLIPVRAFFKWASKQNLVLYNPTADMDLPRIGKRLPMHILSAAEVEKVIAQAKIETPIGLRDRAIMEVFWSTGIRRIELIRLKLYDIDLERGILIIEQGKGKKDRVVPIGDRAARWLERYIVEVRPDLLEDPKERTVFLTADGGQISPGLLTHTMRVYVRSVFPEKNGACHIFRHACATAMLEAGADIRYIQALLGHANLENTAVYTQVSVRHLKEHHARFHPARLSRVKTSAEVRPKKATKGKNGNGDANRAESIGLDDQSEFVDALPELAPQKFIPGHIPVSGK